MARTDRSEGPDDPTRREFFRTFSRQAVHSAGSLAGAATELRRGGVAAAHELFNHQPTPSILPPRPIDPDPAMLTEPQSRFRSPYRFTGEEIVLLDQRELPGRVTTIACRAPSEIASAIRAGAVTGGPVLAELGAYAFALAVHAAAGRPDADRQQLVRAAAGTLRGARPEVRALAWAVDRMEARFDELTDAGADPGALSAAMDAEADALATAAAAEHAGIGRTVAASIVAATAEGTVNMLLHGDMGPLSSGLVGPGTAAIQALREGGRAVHVWATEASPTLEGSRVAALQLMQLDIPHTVIPDSAIGWVFANRAIDAVLLRGDRIAINGDSGTLIGGLVAARLAVAGGVPVHVLAPLSAFDPAAGDRAAIAATRNPTTDVVAAELIAQWVTGADALRPPFDRTLP